MLGIKCPYCDSDVKFSSKSDIIYGRDYGAIYLCTLECLIWRLIIRL